MMNDNFDNQVTAARAYSSGQEAAQIEPSLLNKLKTASLTTLAGAGLFVAADQMNLLPDNIPALTQNISAHVAMVIPQKNK